MRLVVKINIFLRMRTDRRLEAKCEYFIKEIILPDRTLH